jgi:hypothetical protein
MSTHSRVLAAVFAVLCAPVCQAAVITYSATNTAGSTWRYDYAVTNDTLAGSLEEFTIFFDRSFHTDLALSSSPADWDSIVVQPDLNLPDDGFFDSLALSGGLSAGDTLSGFSVTFDWLGVGQPGSQLWTVVDPLSFETIESGFTVLLEPPVDVPEPGTVALLIIGLLGAVSGRRNARQHPASAHP